mgnify:CR=1 FL=1
MLKLGVNIDHVATLREARYRDDRYSINVEPSPKTAADLTIAGGADSITMHVREDLRHLQPEDARAIKSSVSVPINLEMGLTQELIDFALELSPDDVCLVPEHRQEVTTEGGLNVTTNFAAIKSCTKTLQNAGILVSLFIDPDLKAIELAADIGAAKIELHTGQFANTEPDSQARADSLERLDEAACLAHSLGIIVNAGHGINYHNIEDILTLPHLNELNIGHSIISRSIAVGLTAATAEMKALMESYTVTS